MKLVWARGPIIARENSSGGEQQRVVLARAPWWESLLRFAGGTKPTGNLDFRTGEMIFELIEDLHTT